jgi:hypothetical protein
VPLPGQNFEASTIKKVYRVLFHKFFLLAVPEKETWMTEYLQAALENNALHLTKKETFFLLNRYHQATGRYGATL